MGERTITRVELHCHSVHSDGLLTPRELANHLAAKGVIAAALTDHNSVEGLEEFRRALARHEIAAIPGVEVTCYQDARELHLLAYGFDPTHPELLAALAALRQASAPQVQSVAASLRTKGTPVPPGETPLEGRLDAAAALALIHRAGGRAFLAHPLVTEPDGDRLESLVTHLQKLGLDGLEAFHSQQAEEEARRLVSLADRLGLLVSAGSDVHDRKALSAGVDIPAELWSAFRDAVVLNGVHAPSPGLRRRAHFHWREFAFHFAVPTLLAILLFVGVIFAILLPAFERSLMDRKREMIRELTNSAWSLLAEYEREERAGSLTRAQAQALAAARIEKLRYGPERKNYFWLQDTQPRIIMHPYRPDLNGQDVSDFRDPHGVAIFQEFVRLVERDQEGYAKYVWQWQDDPNRLAPKESFVRGFAPWGWIIGTGIYIEDVTQEIGRIERRLTHISLLVSALVVLLLFYVMFEGLRLERERAEAEESLRESTERYRLLVEAATEGMLLVMEGRCRYANRTFLEMLGAPLRELELLDLADLFPASDENAEAWEQLRELLRGEDPGKGFEAVLQQRDGGRLECVIQPSRIAFANRSGFILLVRDVAHTPGGSSTRRVRELEEAVGNLQASLLFLHQPVVRYLRPPVFCPPELSLRAVAELMSEHQTGLVLIRAATGAAAGSITEGDLRRLVAAGASADDPSGRAMSALPVSLPRDAHVYEALRLMEQRGLQQIAVVDEAGEIRGLVSYRDLLPFRDYGPLALTREIEQASTPEEVVTLCRRVPALAQGLLEAGARPQSATHLISGVCNAAATRLLALGEAALGPAPVPYTFLLLGSQGRQEMTLASDQDNALLYREPPEPEADARAREYLLQLGRFACGWLDRAGYPLCKGEVLAQNPRWCQSLSTWKQYFSEWIALAEPQPLLEFTIFFDFHPLGGDVELAQELRRHVFSQLRATPAFYGHFAQNALLYKPPAGPLGGLLGGGGSAGRLDLKEAMTPIVGFARLYALRQEAEATATLARLEALTEADLLPETSGRETREIYEHLLRLRLRQQAAAQVSGESANNLISPRQLGHTDQAILHQAFAHVAALQKRISYDFLGGHGQT